MRSVIERGRPTSSDRPLPCGERAARAAALPAARRRACNAIASALAATVLAILAGPISGAAADAPTIEPGSTAAAGVGSDSATLSATVNPNGNSSFFFFQYYITSMGQDGGSAPNDCSSSPGACFVGHDNSDHTVSGTANGLCRGTTYHFRVAVYYYPPGSPAGASPQYVYGDWSTFSTSGSGGCLPPPGPGNPPPSGPPASPPVRPPTISLSAPIAITQVYTNVTAWIEPNGGDTQYWWLWGLPQTDGSCRTNTTENVAEPQFNPVVSADDPAANSGAGVEVYGHLLAPARGVIRDGNLYAGATYCYVLHAQNSAGSVDTDQRPVGSMADGSITSVPGGAAGQMDPNHWAVGCFTPALDFGGADISYNGWVEYRPRGSNQCSEFPPDYTNPSNQVTIGAAQSNGSSAKLEVTVPGPGTLTASGTSSAKAAAVAARAHRRKRSAIVPISATAAHSGPVLLTLRLTAKARRTLMARGRVRVAVTLTFTPRGGTPHSQRIAVTFRRPVRHKRHHH